jgi:hypothetical protein
VAAYREALKEHTRERVPLQCIWTQSNSIIRLRAFGERTGDALKPRDGISCTTTGTPRDATDAAFEVVMRFESA